MGILTRSKGKRAVSRLPWMRVRGIRQRWLMNSVGVLVTILAILVVGVTLFTRSYYSSTLRAELESKAGTATGYFSSFAGSYDSEEDYLAAACDYVTAYQDADQAQIQLQLLTPSGEVLASNTGLTQQGTLLEAEDITQTAQSMTLSVWRGLEEASGSHVTAVSTPLLYQGELVGIMRYVAPMSVVNRQVMILSMVAVIISVLVLLLVYISNIYFVRSIVDPVKNITDIARRIAGGSYGIQVEKRFDDEVGDLTDAINDMSLQIKQAESMKSEFISSVSHELRTPLTAITGWAETIMGGEARDEEDIRKGMGIIASEARRLSGMVEELLEFSRIEDGRFTLSVELIDIKAEMEDAVYTYHDFLAAEGITLTHTDCEEEFPPIPGDPDRLRQVFCNLLDNAAKHGGAGKRIDTAIIPEEDSVVITVRDYGPGIPEEELPNVKYKFYKGSSTARGSGIGLAVCEEIITRHNGELIIANADDGNGGCLVEIHLPCGTEV